ncbi:addiction module protein [Psychrobacter sp. I-STPA6b]|uniref:addiction module protein n=1 Tax=Psychrobacter sp. I-STPA6b TaxID=2585718 RepID=UPI001D0C5C48|nr:addiction module protein [Psychrobacter sp. I-STPA6b]
MEIALEKLPIEERVSLVWDIWDSIADDPNNAHNLPLDDNQKQTLDKRLADIEQQGFQGRDYQDALTKLREGLSNSVANSVTSSVTNNEC